MLRANAVSLDWMTDIIANDDLQKDNFILISNYSVALFSLHYHSYIKTKVKLTYHLVQVDFPYQNLKESITQDISWTDENYLIYVVKWIKHDAPCIDILRGVKESPRTRLSSHGKLHFKS